MPSAHAAGTIPLALAIQLDTDGSVASNCQATFYRAGTVATKQNVYSDFSLTQAMSNPLSCDQSGRLPLFWIADGLIHVRLTNAAGNPIVDTTMQVLGPSSGGGGGGGTVDPTALYATGDMKMRWGTGPLSGFVRLNGLSIGNVSSGATERANSDTQALFVYLCGADLNLPISGGRSGNCLNDYNASKTLTLPDGRNTLIAGLGDMGNSDRALFSGVTFTSGNSTTLGSVLGAARNTLATTNLPPYTPSFSSPPVLTLTANLKTQNSAGTDQGNFLAIGNTAGTSVGAGSAWIVSNSIAYTFAPQGGASAPFSVVQPTMLTTIYMKL
ncbi:hypothetical protein [Bradyrhizobium betae]|uniref:Uncharacterized protein n=1 Tax=Bradyrhizobium betae TaxID=244734 RepID=A0A5P6NYU6_9BRAD|nr:hypothetical protein [Bradyrhizobium betae]MCS3725510.1 hypothetical protein [Bradyrhizobium betae]QFI71202.1 hypothetical protein F8237_01730 [Bradyrhizobium betae]